MITGFVTPNIQATIRLLIEDSASKTQAIDVIIDTGFSGAMSLPATLVSALGLQTISFENVQVADGSVVRTSVHSATVMWDGKARRVDVHAMGVQQSIGMSMLMGHDVYIRATDGGSVRIELPP